MGSFAGLPGKYNPIRDPTGGGSNRTRPIVPGVHQAPQAPQMPSFGSPMGSFAPPAPVVPGSPPPAPNLQNFAQENPDLKFAADKFKDRFSSDQTQRAMNQAGSQIRDTASGLMKEAQTSAARRGVLGQGDSGILDQQNQKISEAALRDTARASAGIQMGEQQRLDQLATAAPGVLGAQANLGLQQQGLGLKQFETGQQGQLAQQQMQQQAQLAQMQAAMQQQQMLSNLWSTWLGALA